MSTFPARAMRFGVKATVLWLSGTMLGGCCHFQSNLACTQQDAATVQVAVLSVAPWEKYRDAMQPAFKMSSDDALAAAIPNTLDSEQKILDAFAAKAKIALPGASSSDVTTFTSKTGEKPTASESDTTTRSSGDTSKIAFDGSPAGTTTASSLPSGGALSGALGSDPLTKYLAATAVYQEVQLLNRYVKDAAIREGYVPYVVRLQVGLLPWKRDEPYDAYSVISFFMGDFGKNYAIETVALHNELLPTTSTEGHDKRDVKENWMPPTPPCAAGKGPLVLPLLVTDDLESALESRSTEEIRQFASALSAVIQGVGVSTDLQSQYDKLQAAYGHALNSTFTVSRLSDNTLRARFGAIYEPGQGSPTYSMVPQTHNVTLLVLVPKECVVPDSNIDCRMVRLVANTTVVGAEDGKALPSRTKEDYEATARKAFVEHGYTGTVCSDDLSRLASLAAANNYDGFAKLVHDKFCHIKYVESFWTDFISIRLGSKLASATFSVPAEDAFAIVDQQPVLVDDGKSSTIANVYAVKGLQLSKTTVLLKETPGLDKSSAHDGSQIVAGSDVSLAATATSLSADGNILQLTFPSLADLQLTPFQPNSATILFTNDKNVTLKTLTAIYKAKPVTPKPTFVLDVPAKVIDMDAHGTGTLQLRFAKIASGDEIQLSITGAELNEPGTNSIISRQAPTKGTGWSVSGNGVVVLSLNNLNEKANVVITVSQTGHGALDPIILPVSRLTDNKVDKQ